MLSLKCSCHSHKIEIEHDKKFQIYQTFIYNIYSPETGRKYKKPKLLGDVILTEEQFKTLKNYE